MSEHEAVDEACRALRAENARLRRALEDSRLLIDDLLAGRIAPEECGEIKRLEANNRIRLEGGTLAYIAEIQKKNRAALKGEGE